MAMKLIAFILSNLCDEYFCVCLEPETSLKSIIILLVNIYIHNGSYLIWQEVHQSSDSSSVVAFSSRPSFSLELTGFSSVRAISSTLSLFFSTPVVLVSIKLVDDFL